MQNIRKDKTFYVYVHLRPDLTPFYVGKGKARRVHDFYARTQYHKNIVNKYGKENIYIEKVACKNENEAFFREIEAIERFKEQGFVLCNMTEGGEGASGAIVSIETRLKKSRTLKGHVTSEETKEKISAAQKGKPRPWQIGRKLSPEGVERLKNRVFTEEHRRKISEAKKGVPNSPEHIEKMRQANLGKKLSPETIEKIVKSREGFKHSEETKRKMSESKKGKTSKLKGRKLSDERREQIRLSWIARKAKMLEASK